MLKLNILMYGFFAAISGLFARGTIPRTIRHSRPAHHTDSQANNLIEAASELTPRQDDITTRDYLSPGDLDRLTNMSCLLGANADTPGFAAWIGSDGSYTNTFINQAGEDLILIIWGSAGSWVNTIPPLITMSLATQAVETISFAVGPGAWSTVYSDTRMSNGQISNTWGEYNFGENGSYDVSREVNMLGHNMSIVTPQCTADMETCVFVCSSGEVCMTDYLLLNCDNGSQEGAGYSIKDGFPSGGCGWSGLSNANVKTIFN